MADRDRDGDQLVAAFERWAADERVDAAAQARSRERWLRQQAAEAATLVGLLVDLAEQRAPVTLAVGGTRLSGRLAGVGQDACVVTEQGATVVVALAHLVAVHASGPRPGLEPAGDRSTVGSWRMADALGALAAERSPVRLTLADGEHLAGDLLTAGEDVLTLRPADGQLRVHVPLAAVLACTAV